MAAHKTFKPYEGALVWNYYLRSEDGQHAKCLLCPHEKVFSCKGASTSGLHAHLSSHHAHAMRELPRRDDSLKQPAPNPDTLTPLGTQVQISLRVDRAVLHALDTSSHHTQLEFFLVNKLLNQCLGSITLANYLPSHSLLAHPRPHDTPHTDPPPYLPQHDHSLTGDKSSHPTRHLQTPQINGSTASQQDHPQTSPNIPQVPQDCSSTKQKSPLQKSSSLKWTSMDGHSGKTPRAAFFDPQSISQFPNTTSPDAGEHTPTAMPSEEGAKGQDYGKRRATDVQFHNMSNDKKRKVRDLQFHDMAGSMASFSESSTQQEVHSELPTQDCLVDSFQASLDSPAETTDSSQVEVKLESSTFADVLACIDDGEDDDITPTEPSPSELSEADVKISPVISDDAGPSMLSANGDSHRFLDGICPGDEEYSAYDSQARLDGVPDVCTTNRSQKPLIRCSRCPYQTRWSNHMKYHELNVHSQAKPFTCPLCHHSCKMKWNMKKHLRSTHKMDRLQADAIMNSVLQQQ